MPDKKQKTEKWATEKMRSMNMTLKNLRSQKLDMYDRFDRRTLLSRVALAGTLSGWLDRVAAHAAEQEQAKSCILLWMSGGPSHLDTFDLKPEGSDRIRGEFKP